MAGGHRGPAAGHVWRGRGAAHPPRLARRLVSGAGDIKLTKDGNVLLQEMVSWVLPAGVGAVGGHREAGACSYRLSA